MPHMNGSEALREQGRMTWVEQPSARRATMGEHPTGMRILVVEDESHATGILRDAVTKLGHQARLVATAEAGLSALTSEPFDAVLLDLRLPGMSGLDLLQARMVRDCGIPVIGLSGVGTEAEVRGTLQFGATDFLQKPASLDLMREVLDYVRVQTAAPNWANDRRRSPRPRLAIPVRVVEYDRPAWQATSMDLSVFGIRIGGQAPRAPGQIVKLDFTLPGGGSGLDLFALPVWHGAEGRVFRFVNLSAVQYERLRDVVQRLAA